MLGLRGGDGADLGFDRIVGPHQVGARSPSLPSSLALTLLPLGCGLASAFTSSLDRWFARTNPLGALDQVVGAVAEETGASAMTFGTSSFSSVLAFISDSTGQD